MVGSHHPRIKICCISSREEAWLAIRCGASALGLVSEMPSGPGVISEEQIAAIVTIVPPGVATFLLTCKQEVPGIIEQHKRCGVSTIQIVDTLESGTHADLRTALPGIKIVQVIHVSGEKSVEQSEKVAPQVDALLLDSGNPELQVKELGGTGRTHNWEISKRIRERVTVPVFLAGGLNPGNVAAAVQEVAPFGLDVCNGVRTDGKLDETKLAAFFSAANT
ncbi:phosphoribosylanthranilate isomerase [candidate division KSB1 bacterium]|nr:phosphoribosylanthranilate isomerase [candidate division KSB1 bacterium]